jgi:hypothetical protein
MQLQDDRKKRWDGMTLSERKIHEQSCLKFRWWMSEDSRDQLAKSRTRGDPRPLRQQPMRSPSVQPPGQHGADAGAGSTNRFRSRTRRSASSTVPGR